MEIKREKWWYRLLQVAYSMLAVIAVLIWIAGVAIAIELRLSVDTYSSRYQILCEDGTLRGDFKGSELNYSRTDFETDSFRKYTMFSCLRTDLREQDLSDAYDKIILSGSSYIPVSGSRYIPVEQRAVEQDLIPSKRNYEIVMLKEIYQGSWWYVFLAVTGGLVFIPIIFVLVRSTFLYIVFNEPFRKTLSFWHKRIE